MNSMLEQEEHNKIAVINKDMFCTNMFQNKVNAKQPKRATFLILNLDLLRNQKKPNQVLWLRRDYK